MHPDRGDLLPYPRPQAPFGRSGGLIVGMSLAVLAFVAIMALEPRFGAILAVLSVAIVAWMWFPGAVFALYLLLPYVKGAVQPYSPVDLTIVLAAMNAAQLIPLLAQRRPHRISQAGVVAWALLGSLIVGGVLYAPDPSLAVRDASSFVVLVLIPIPIGALRVASQPRYLAQFLWTVFGLSAFMVISGLVRLSGGERLTVLEQNTIQTARAALLTPILAATLVLPTGRRLLTLTAIVLSIGAIVVGLATGSRGPMSAAILLAVLAAIWRLISLRRLDWRPVSIAVGTVLVTLVILSSVTDALPEESTARFTSFGDDIQAALFGPGGGDPSDGQGESRLVLYGFALTLFAEQPMLGAGTSGFETLAGRRLGTDAADYPHDAVLQFAAEYGIVGSMVFLVLVGLALLRRLPDRADARAVRALVLFFLFNAMVSGNIVEDRETWGTIVVILCLGRSVVAGVRDNAPEPSDTTLVSRMAGAPPGSPTIRQPGVRSLGAWRSRQVL